VNQKLIKPQTLKGFRDHLPNAMMAREHLIEIARTVYRSYGFSPIDTPALEYSEILLGKGGDESEKQMFRFMDQGNRDVSMRFDLTIPLARFSAQHLQEIGTPFKRYHIGTVWRGEKPAKGRYREFMQCDFDTIGTASNLSDIETLFVIHDLFEALGFQNFAIHVNNRKILNGMLEKLNLRDKSEGVLRSLDKLAKIGQEKVVQEMNKELGIPEEEAQKFISLVSVQGTPIEILDQLSESIGSEEEGQIGMAHLRELFDAVEKAGIPAERIKLDVSIARGLDYYTGTIYETFLGDLPGIGSVCSGGRYDNLAGLFTNQKLPGVGASLGLDRLLAAMQELGLLETSSTPAPVLITIFDAKYQADYLRLGRILRKAGIETEVYSEVKKMKKQLTYANRKGFQVAIIAGDDEFSENLWQVKDLINGEQEKVSEQNLTDHIKKLLNRSE
jgi:histidyl-tRNA synthetase